MCIYVAMVIACSNVDDDAQMYKYVQYTSDHGKMSHLTFVGPCCWSAIGALNPPKGRKKAGQQPWISDDDTCFENQLISLTKKCLEVPIKYCGEILA